jgi:hypothetical protein
MNGRRITDNEIIANWREFERRPSRKHQLLVRIIHLLPFRARRWVLEAIMRHTTARALRSGYTQADLDAIVEHVKRMRTRQ